MRKPSDPPDDNRKSAVPSSRLGRLWALSSMASNMAARGLVQRAQRGKNPGDSKVPQWLTVDNARIMADRLSHLRGAAMKLGQMISMHGDQLLPREFADALGKLRSQADTMPTAQVHQVLRDAYGDNWRDRFAELDAEPIASASIGQVHRAQAQDGRVVALKIQYPGVAESIDSDVDNLASLVSLGRMLPSGVDLRGVLEELKRQLRAETDYVQEAHNAATYAERLAGEPGFRVPTVHLDLTTPRTLAMDFVACPNLFTWADDATQDERDEIARRLVTLTLRELLWYRLSQTDPNLGNYLWDTEQREIVLLDFGATQEVPTHVSQNYADVLQAAMASDHQAMRRALIAAGALDRELNEDNQAFYTDVALEATSLIREAKPHNFGEDDLLHRMRGWAKEGLKRGKPLRSPPAEITFFQRKLGGTYLMCKRLKARVDCRTICEQVLQQAGYLTA